MSGVKSSTGVAVIAIHVHNVILKLSILLAKPMMVSVITQTLIFAYKVDTETTTPSY